MNVLAYLTAIREYVPSFGFSFDIVSDSNPKQSTSSSLVEIGGRLETARAQSAVGTLLVGQGKVPLPSDPSWFVRGYAERYDYPGGDMDSGYAQLLAGKDVNLGIHGLDFEGGGHLATYAGRSRYQGSTLRTSDFVRVYPTVAVNLVVDARELRYDDFPFLSGWQYVATGEVRYAISPASSIFAGARLRLSNGGRMSVVVAGVENEVEVAVAEHLPRARIADGHGSDLENVHVSRDSMLSMIFKLGMSAQLSWRPLKGFEFLAKVIDGVKFRDGLEQPSSEAKSAARKREREHSRVAA